jgi:drug/metabolite transporter (DMT)-like permease
MRYLPGLKTKAAPVGGLLLLCFLWALVSLRSDLLPGSLQVARSSPLASEAVSLAVFAVIAAVAASLRKAPWPRGSKIRATALAGLGLFAVPSVLIEVANGTISAATRVALFSLTPVFAVVLEPHLGSPSARQQRGALAAALIAVFGTLLVFPLDVPLNVPRSGAVAFAFCAILAAVVSVAAANCLSVRLACEQSAPSMVSFAALATGIAAITLGASSALLERHTWSAPNLDPWTALDLSALVLLFWLMHRMTAVPMTTRFLIAPLLANLIGLAFFRPGVQSQGWVGLLLITAGSGWLLLGPRDEPEENGSSLGIHQR